LEIRTSFIPLGRKSREIQRTDPWFKAKQKERNKIEGAFGREKEHYGLDRVKYAGKDGEEMWVRGGGSGRHELQGTGGEEKNTHGGNDMA
jgi:hypothetical protein